MIRRRGVCFLIFFLIFSLRVVAIEAVVSHTVFYVPDAGQHGRLLPRVETYWRIKPNSIRYFTTPEKTIAARIRTDITLTNDKGDITRDRFILQTVPRTSVGDLGRQTITDLRGYAVPARFTKLKLELVDLSDTTNRFVYTDTFTVQPAEDRPFYSEIELLDTVFEATAQTVFSKNGRQQIPLCANFLDDDKGRLQYYAELYGIDHLSKSDFPLVQKVSIGKKENGYPVEHFIKKDTIATSRQLSVASGDFLLGSLVSGNYYLNVALENHQRQLICTKSYFFQRLNLHPVEDTAKAAALAATDTAIERVNVVNLNKTFIAKYSLAEVRTMLKMLLPFSDNAAKNTINGFLKNPDELYMRYYVYNYFASINKSDPGRAWKDFSERIIEVNKKFTVHGTPGFETDRGFVYLRYGEPSEVVTVTNESGAVPYEIWQYNMLKQTNGKEVVNAMFLFYKPNEMTEGYRILHSTVPGETQNYGWRTYLYPNTQDVSDMNSRAIQMIGNR
jgi:GWxTD domain-containing protein